MFTELLKTTKKCETCKVAGDETVVLLTDTAIDENVADAFFVAAATTTITVEPFPVLTNPPEVAIRAMCEADIVFDLASNPWLYTEPTERILASGTRMFQVIVNVPLGPSAETSG